MYDIHSHTIDARKFKSRKDLEKAMTYCAVDAEIKSLQSKKAYVNRQIMEWILIRDRLKSNLLEKRKELAELQKWMDEYESK